VQQNPNPQYNQNPATPTGAGFAEPRGTATNTPDPHYDLISILYHALDGAQTCARYAEDAGRTGDKELAQFFMQVQQNQLSCSEKAKQLLGRRLSSSSLH
jgi:hypothetical protein